MICFLDQILVSLLEFMESADDELKQNLYSDLNDYLNEIEKTEIIWMAVFMVVICFFFLVFFVFNMFKKVSELEVMNYVLNKLVSIAKKENK